MFHCGADEICSPHLDAAVWLAFTVTAVCLTAAPPPPAVAAAVASTEASSDLDAAESISPLA